MRAKPASERTRRTASAPGSREVACRISEYAGLFFCRRTVATIRYANGGRELHPMKRSSMKFVLAVAAIVALIISAESTLDEMEGGDRVEAMQARYADLNNRIEEALLTARFERPSPWIKVRDGARYYTYVTREEGLEDLRHAHKSGADKLESAVARAQSNARRMPENALFAYGVSADLAEEKLTELIDAEPQTR